MTVIVLKGLSAVSHANLPGYNSNAIAKVMLQNSQRKMIDLRVKKERA